MEQTVFHQPEKKILNGAMTFFFLIRLHVVSIKVSTSIYYFTQAGKDFPALISVSGSHY